MKKLSMLIILLVCFLASQLMAQDENEWRFPVTFKVGIGTIFGHTVEKVSNFPEYMRTLKDSLTSYIVPNDSLNFAPHVNLNLGISWGPRFKVGEWTLSVRLGGFYSWDLAYATGVPQAVRLGEPAPDGRRPFYGPRYKHTISFPVYQAELEKQLAEIVEGPKINWLLGYYDIDQRTLEIVNGWKQGKSLKISKKFDAKEYRTVVILGGVSITGEVARWRVIGGFSGIYDDEQQSVVDLIVKGRDLYWFFALELEVDTRKTY